MTDSKKRKLESTASTQAVIMGGSTEQKADQAAAKVWLGRPEAAGGAQAACGGV